MMATSSAGRFLMERRPYRHAGPPSKYTVKIIKIKELLT